MKTEIEQQSYFLFEFTVSTFESIKQSIWSTYAYSDKNNFTT